MVLFLSFVTAVFLLQPGEAKLALAPPEMKYYTQSSGSHPERDNVFANRLSMRPIEFRIEYPPKNKSSLTHCESQIEQALTALPAPHQEMLHRLTLTFSHLAWRGLGGDHEIKIRCVHMTDHELASVFTHEMGHVIDPYLLHEISFSADEKKKSETSSEDFVSDYGSTNPYEDFAESYAYYVMHGEKFRLRGAENPILKEKYELLRAIFEGVEYRKDKKVSGGVKRPYDITVIGP